MSDTNSSEKIRINGKQQMIELLRFMDNDEKTKLLRNMAYRNPVMTRELMEQSFTFEDFMELTGAAIIRCVSYISPTILGVALKTSPIEFQRKVLSTIDRKIAEEAFSYMQRNISMRDSEKAQRKICEVAIALSRKKVISLS
jgi:flagellar motor switch protein FliG